MGKMISFRHVNAEGDFARLLTHHGLEFTQRGQQIRLLCPFHEDTNPSLSITLEDTGQAMANTFHCFGCGEKGSLIDFEARLAGVDLREAARAVAEISGCALAPSRTSKRKPLRGAETPRKGPSRSGSRPSAETPATADPGSPEATSGTNPPLSFTLTLDPGHESVLRRLDEEAADYFGVGVVSKGSMAGRICIPIHNAAGELIAYAGRWADQEVPDGEDKYRFPPKFNKMAELFNLHRLTARDQHIVIVEGFFGAMRLHQLGVPVVALMGTALSEEHVALLKRHGVRSALVLLDGDGAGRKASVVVGQTLVRHLFTRVVELPDGAAPDEMDEASLSAVLPYWSLKNQF